VLVAATLTMEVTTNLSFSVLMSVYIKETPEFLSQALDSILINQTITPNEVIIVQDGPLSLELTDVLKRYCNLFPKIIKIFKLHVNAGLAKALNYGLEKCINEWVFRMDSDDMAVSVRFEKQLEIIQTGNYDVIGCSIMEFNNVPGDLNQFRTMPEKHSDIINFMKLRNPLNHMTVAYRKSKVLQAGGYSDKPYYEDYDLWYEIYKIGGKFYNIQESLVNARIGNNMIGRRSGYDYYKYETQLTKKFVSDGFINTFQYRAILWSKFILRHLPKSMLNFMYQKFLRKSK